MKKLFIIFFTLLIPFLFPKTAQALDICESLGVNITATPNPINLDEEEDVKISVSGPLIDDGKTEYYIVLEAKWSDKKSEERLIYSGGTLNFEVKDISTVYNNIKADIVLVLYNKGMKKDQEVCKSSQQLIVYKNTCTISTDAPGVITVNDPISIRATDLDADTNYRIVISKNWGLKHQKTLKSDAAGGISTSFEPISTIGTYRASVEATGVPGQALCESAEFEISALAVSPTPKPDSSASGGSTIDATHPKTCKTKNGKDGIQIAIGCIPTETGDFISYLLTRAVSVGGGLAFLIMLFGAFTLLTSAGNPENLQKGKDLIVSALIGLLFIIFSIYLLKFIGVDILNLSEFSSPDGGVIIREPPPVSF